VGFAFCIRRPAETPRDFSSEAAHRAVFRTKEQIDVDTLRRMGVPAGTADLKVGQFWHQGPGGGSWHMHNGWMDVNGNLFECLLTT
jgi:hypothetical protein